MVWKFCGKAQFPHSFAWFARNYAETVPFRKISTSGNWVKLRCFSQCIRFFFYINSIVCEKCEYGHVDCLYMKLALYKRFLYWNKVFKKQSSYWQNSVLCDRLILYSLYYLSYYWLLTGQFYMEMLRFQFLYFQLKNSTPVFWERFLFFRKLVSMFELLKTFKFSSDCHIKACQPLKQRAISKISSNFFLKEPMLFLLALKWNLLDKAFACVKPKTRPNFAVKLLKGATF